VRWLGAGFIYKKNYLLQFLIDAGMRLMKYLALAFKGFS
jgi:hypothetical protein